MLFATLGLSNARPEPAGVKGGSIHCRAPPECNIVNSMPEACQQDVSNLTPHLFVSNAAAAIDFYKKAFGAEEVARNGAPDGKRIMHASLLINGHTLMLCDDFPEMRGGKSSTPEALGGSPVVLHLQVQDADATWNRAVGAGAQVIFPLADQFWGDRYGQVKDPFGHTWSIGARVRNVSKEDVAEASKAHF